MKIATFNIQNLFHRHKDLIKRPAVKNVLEWIKEMDFLMRKPVKEVRDIDRIKELSFLLGFENKDRTSYAVMRKKEGELYFRGSLSSVELKANYLTQWRGWTEIKTIPIDPVAIQHKARVIAEVNPDILLLQEVEDRSSLSQFNKDILPSFNTIPYREVLVVQGNDEKGQEFGLMTKNGYQIGLVENFSNEYDQDDNLLFDKNLIQYQIITPSKNIVWLIAVHFKNQEGEKEISDYIRFRQASRVADLYLKLREEGRNNIIIAGSLNAVSYCYSLSSLLQKTDLKDISRHSSFKVARDNGEDAGYFRMGGYKMGVNIKQTDYLLFSPELFKKIKNCGLNRKAVWPDKRPQWNTYASLQNSSQAASSHPVIFAEIDWSK